MTFSSCRVESQEIILSSIFLQSSEEEELLPIGRIRPLDENGQTALIRWAKEQMETSSVHKMELKWNIRMAQC